MSREHWLPAIGTAFEGEPAMSAARLALVPERDLACYAAIRGVHRVERSAAELARYVDDAGRTHAVLACPGAGGSVLVLDTDLTARCERLLVAHLAADEPSENAALVCCDYLERVKRGDHRCRALVPEDQATEPFADDRADVHADPEIARVPISTAEQRFTLCAVDTGMSIPELRWCASPASPGPGAPVHIRTLCLREVIAKVQSYQPARAITERRLRCHRADAGISTSVLRYELLRVQNSPIVLNRGLREAVLAVVERGQLSMSEIAMRCGRVKRDSAGSESGETSWLARRIGLLPEAGRPAPTPWVHSDVLALIAREGLGIGPREVELG